MVTEYMGFVAKIIVGVLVFAVVVDIGAWRFREWQFRQRWRRRWLR